MQVPLDRWPSSLRPILSAALAEQLPLTRAASGSRSGDPAAAAQLLRSSSAATFFPGAREPLAAQSGLLLRLGDWESSHEVSQDVASVAGSYWHGIAHRMEPDDFNAAYWFRRVGQHPIFPDLREAVAAVLDAKARSDWRLGLNWDPFLFIEWCSKARVSGDPDLRSTAQAIQNIEWTLLFTWCAEPVK